MDLVDHVLDLFHTFAQVHMAWWVSATALIGSLLGGVWLKHDRLVEAGAAAVHAVCALGAVFIGSVVGYGILMVFGAYRLRADMIGACAPAGEGCAEHLRTFFDLAPYALMIGTSSFVIAFLIWLGMWLRLHKELSTRGRDDDGTPTAGPIAATPPSA